MSYSKWWISMAMLVHQRVSVAANVKIPNHLTNGCHQLVEENKVSQYPQLNLARLLESTAMPWGIPTWIISKDPNLRRWCPTWPPDRCFFGSLKPSNPNQPTNQPTNSHWRQCLLPPRLQLRSTQPNWGEGVGLLKRGLVDCSYFWSAHLKDMIWF